VKRGAVIEEQLDDFETTIASSGDERSVSKLGRERSSKREREERDIIFEIRI
jgi:hypothetical protein